jgi:hypothetical protein
LLMNFILGFVLLLHVAGYLWTPSGRLGRHVASSSEGGVFFEQEVQPGWFTFDKQSLLTKWRADLLWCLEFLASEELPSWLYLKLFSIWLRAPEQLPPLLILAVALVTLWVRHPRWVPPGLAKRLPHVTILTLAAILLWVGRAALGPILYLWGQGALPPTRALLWLSDVFSYALVAGNFALLSPALAFEWGLIWQVARGERWDLRRGIRGLLQYWPPVLVINVTYWGLFYYVTAYTYWLWPAPHQSLRLLQAAAFCLPWLVVGRGLGLRAALGGVVTIWREYWRDLLVYFARYMAIALLVGSPLKLLQDAARGGLVTGFLTDSIVMLFNLVLGLSLVLLFIEIVKARRSRKRLSPPHLPTPGTSVATAK